MVPKAIAGVVIMLGAALPAQAQDAGSKRARIDYLLHCSGCHGQDGTGRPEKGIPNFVGQIGYFQRLPEGREFVLQVPGLLSAGLPDARAAEVVNWITRRYGGESVPADFAPVSEEEARMARLHRPADVMAKRDAIYQKLLGQGYVIK